MKRILIAACLLLSSCSTPGESRIVYLDDAFAEMQSFNVDATAVCTSYNGNYALQVKLLVKNTSDKSLSVNLSDLNVRRQSSGSTYKVEVTGFSTINLDSDISGTFTLSSVIPTNISAEGYTLSSKINGSSYTLNLYNTPESKRSDLTVTYKIGDEIIKTTTVKERRILNEKYVYENPNHLSHCSEWKMLDGKAITANTVITENLTVYGKEVENIEYFELSDSKSSFVEKVSYIPYDGIVVVPSVHGKLEVTALSNFGVYQLPNLYTLYLPKTINRIYSGNFTNCPKLAVIFFAGTQTEWNSIQSSSTVPSNVNVVCEVAFKY